MKKRIAGLLTAKSRIICIVCMVAFSLTALHGQKTAKSANTSLQSDSLIQEKLVELAMKGPLFSGSNHQNKINELQLKRARNAWTNLLTLSANYNDQTFSKTAQTPNGTAYVYPKYFFGLNIPIGTLLSKTEIKSAKEQIEISKDNQAILSRNIRADILTKYKQYKNYEELIIMQSQVVDDEETAFLQAKEKFRNGGITIEAHNTAQKNYNDELAKRMSLQLQQDVLKLEIEKLIGVPLESVMQ